MGTSDKNRDQLNAEADAIGVDNPEAFATKEDLASEIAFQRDVAAHLADPQNAPLPEGTVINFGDPQPIRREGGQA